MEMKRGLRTSLLVTLVALTAMTIAILWFTFRFRQMFDTYSTFTIALITTYTLIILIYLPVRIILYTLYKPYEDKDYRPTVTVIVPAYNEGAFVEKTLKALVKCTYPKDRLQIIAVDDGSKDDTFDHMLKVAKEYPDMIKAIRFDKNRGKREAMSVGVENATGEIIVFIDSDTRIKKDAIQHLIAPFEDPRIGGTTGKVKVENQSKNFLTRMLGVRYIMSFDFYRCTSSVFGAITCLSGVISAYRKEHLLELLPEWRNQMFLGRECTFGDDRSLTNHILKRDYLTVYCRNAVAYTLAPETLTKLFKMLIRWNKSFLRETLVLMQYILKPRNMKKRKMLLYEAIMTSIMPLLMMTIVISIYFRIAMDPLYILTVILSITMMSMIYMMFYIKAERNWRFVYGIVYAFFFMTILIWLMPYAFLTIGRTHWGTR